MNKKSSDEVISVSAYLAHLNTVLKTERAKIVGEVSEVKRGPSGHIYFSLKDEKDGSVISCIIWSFRYGLSGIELKDGIKIYASGVPSIYTPTGRLSFVADVIEHAGEGALKVAYEKLMKKIEAEGLFAENRKRPLPDLPHRIGVITSKNGAVINDFLMNIGKFGYEILFVDSRVEGQEAIDDLLSAVQTLAHKNIDVLVIMRGGGSLESFQAFNNEALVRAVAGFPVPVLTGIGHDKDVPLISLVSDKNVSTPTAAASILSESWNQSLHIIQLSEEKIFSRFQSDLNIFKNSEKIITYSVSRIESGISKLSENIKNQSKELTRGFEVIQNKTVDFLKQSLKSIRLASPERVLSQGYSIVKFKGKVVRKTKDVSRGDELLIQVSDGVIQSEVI